MSAAASPPGTVRIGVIGTGVVGGAVASLLVGLPGVERVVLLGGSARVLDKAAAALGDATETRSDHVGSDLPDLADLGIVVLCGPDELQPDQARVALGAGCHVVSLADSAESIDALLGLDDFAREVGRTVVVGAAMSPGWSTILARHAASLFDEVDDVSVAVTGSGGPACVERRTRAARSDTQEWRDGEWVECPARSAPELVWFPEPLGAVDCARGDLSEAIMLRRVLPDVAQLVAKMGRPVARPMPSRVRRLRRSSTPREPGGLRVAVSGRADGQPLTVVYGMLCAAGEGSAALAVSAVEGLLVGASTGALGVAELLEPVPALRAAAGRGVSALVYEGID